MHSNVSSRNWVLSTRSPTHRQIPPRMENGTRSSCGSPVRDLPFEPERATTHLRQGTSDRCDFVFCHCDERSPDRRAHRSRQETVCRFPPTFLGNLTHPSSPASC